ncbi:hypothetical protein H5407_16370 [Mitsuaria sp. WAJ17]|uniref:hypothetical protein n=1 Tax=Mitsuaria sp. WAJ17 TaxID=2761452 RepID=UPI0015FEC194|nr:hypothetical protein [Mitsuaria sp. WAJ17]MBB2486803.1 hypothetical protein [Mitsuaria sp. WAJ17]
MNEGLKRLAASLRPGLVAGTASALLAACGGGGSGLDPAPACSPGTVTLVASGAPQAGRNVEAQAQACGFTLGDPQWTQTQGATLPLMSARSAAISVEPAAGDYGFSFSYLDAQGQRKSLPLQLSVPASTGPALVVRGDPSLWSGDGASLRAWLPSLSAAEAAGATYSWTQTDGPSAQGLQGQDTARLLFKGPAVSKDVAMKFRVDVKLASGQSLSQSFQMLLLPQPGGTAQPLFDASNPSSRVYPYLQNGPRAEALAACIYSPQLDRGNLCPMSRLPMLGTETGGATPTVEQVMARVLVSHDWMAQVFERYLREQDTHGDFRNLLKATTAVVIGARVRPAFYWSATGAIYLDASYLWLTPQQRDTVSETPDPRADFGGDLGYTMLWRYVKDKGYAGGSYPVAERKTRELPDLHARLGSLLYHELTHAGDFTPPRLHSVLNPALRVFQVDAGVTASDDLAAKLPLRSAEMVGLGKVQFFGKASTAAQRAYTPQDITGFFEPDRATDEYNYSLPDGASVGREDAAMLAEEAMMQLRFGILRDVAITPPMTAASTSSNILLSWGQRGRVGEAKIKPRVALVMSQVMPWIAPDELDKLATPQALPAGKSWLATLDPAAAARPSEAQRRQADEALQEMGGRRQDRRRAANLQRDFRPSAQ